MSIIKLKLNKRLINQIKRLLKRKRSYIQTLKTCRYRCQNENPGSQPDGAWLIGRKWGA